MYLQSILAGIIVGFVLGFLGAGGTVVGLPIFLIFSNLPGHQVLGTNAAGVAMVAASIFAWRLYKKDVSLLIGVITRYHIREKLKKLNNQILSL